MKSNLSIHGTMVRFDTFHPPSSHAIFHFSRVKSFRPPLPSPESGREALHFRSLTRAQPNAIFLSFFLFSLYRCHLSNQLAYLFVTKFRNFHIFFSSRRSFEAERVQQVTPHVRVSLPSVDIARRTRDRDANSRMEKEGEGGRGGSRVAR